MDSIGSNGCNGFKTSNGENGWRTSTTTTTMTTTSCQSGKIDSNNKKIDNKEVHQQDRMWQNDRHQGRQRPRLAIA